MKVLIVDDLESIRLYVAEFYITKGHEAVTVDCGEKAIECFRNNRFDIVLMDIVMPGIDGFETARQLQNISRDEWVPIIFMSARNADEEMRKGIMSGGGFYLPKPLNPVQLESYIHVTEQLINTQNALRHKAQYDELTGLPNRSLVLDRISVALKHADRNKDKVAVLFIDLDRFKQVNDTWGHAAGDELLKETATRLTSAIRASDTVAHMGGDEFTVILPGITRKKSAEDIPQKILHALNKPFHIDGMPESYVTGSIGIAIYPDDATDVGTLIKYADTAMYKAKASGKNKFQFYHSDMGNDARKITQIDNGLRRAIISDEFELHYQPQICSNSMQLIGAEVLLRWNNPELGTVSPGLFIPVAEETGIIMDIGEWVIEQACRQMNIWKQEGNTLPKIAINLSCKQLSNTCFSDRTLDILKKARIDLSLIEIEITESAVMENPEHALEVLTAIRDMGISLAIDDFGTGYSSMIYLRNLPINKLKIDMEFIRDLPHSLNDCAITRAIIALAHSLNMKVVAEGVETIQQLDFLQQEQCDFIQGYYFGKPETAEVFSARLRERTIDEKIHAVM
jgi:diguanylate cyclase (GGDEF)-like protein